MISRITMVSGPIIRPLLVSAFRLSDLFVFDLLGGLVATSGSGAAHEVRVFLAFFFLHLVGGILFVHKAEELLLDIAAHVLRMHKVAVASAVAVSFVVLATLGFAEVCHGTKFG